MLLKESKIKVLENFYSLDYIFFGKPVKKMDTCCPALVEEYLAVKGALSSVVIEMLKLIEHSPEKLTEKVDLKAMTKSAIESAKVCRENAKKIVSTEKARGNIKASLKEQLSKEESNDIPKLVEGLIREKAFRLATDNLLIAKAINESKKYTELNEWSGKIIEDSYKILRDSLVEAAIAILASDEESK